MATGPTRREQSEPFSLSELMKLEDERLRELQQERVAREESAARERADSERRRREEADAAERAAADARERARQAELELVARREAMQKAVVEQSRLEVEVRARAEERELERKHELELQRLRMAGKTGQLGSLAGATFLGGAVMLCVTLAVHFAVVKPSNEHRLAELQMNVVGESTRAEELVREIGEQKRTKEGLERTVSSQAQEIEQLKSRCAKAPAPTIAHKTAPSAPPPPPPPPPLHCLKGDPLCPTIQR